MLVLLDLDGTLIESAPDLYAALVDLAREEGRRPPELTTIRSVVSLGSMALLAAGLGSLPDEPEEREHLRSRFLAAYRGRGFSETTWMPGIPELLQALDRDGHRWGVVTNKPLDLTQEILRRLLVDDLPPPAVVVAGDSLPVKKPDPAPLLYALALAHGSTEEGLYVGDARADVEAAHAAGLPAYVALWGYLGTSTPAECWGAEGLLRHPLDLLIHLDRTVEGTA